MKNNFLGSFELILPTINGQLHISNIMDRLWPRKVKLCRNYRLLQILVANIISLLLIVGKSPVQL